MEQKHQKILHQRLMKDILVFRSELNHSSRYASFPLSTIFCSLWLFQRRPFKIFISCDLIFCAGNLIKTPCQYYFPRYQKEGRQNVTNLSRSAKMSKTPAAKGDPFRVPPKLQWNLHLSDETSTPTLVYRLWFKYICQKSMQTPIFVKK